MVEYTNTELNGIFGALADPTRRAILERLRGGRATVSELADPFDMTVQGISKHLKRLEAAGLIRQEKEGREVWCELVPDPMLSASSWLDEQRTFWERRLDRLEDVLRQSTADDQSNPSTQISTEARDDNPND